jgi:hypothetical protein
MFWPMLILHISFKISRWITTWSLADISWDTLNGKIVDRWQKLPEKLYLHSPWELTTHNADSWLSSHQMKSYADWLTQLKGVNTNEWKLQSVLKCSFLFLCFLGSTRLYWATWAWHTHHAQPTRWARCNIEGRQLRKLLWKSCCTMNETAAL